MSIPRKRRPESEQEKRRRSNALCLPRRWGINGRRPRSLWFFDIHRTRWRPRKRYRYAPRLDETIARAAYALACMESRQA